MAVSEKGWPVPITARCPKCGATRRVSDFPRNRNTDTGYSLSSCRQCSRSRNRRWYAANKPAVREYTQRYYVDNAESRRAYSRDYRAANRGACNEAIKRWRADNEDHRRRYREAHRQQAAQHQAKRRAQQLETRHEPYNRVEILARWSSQCCYCSAPAEHLDHVTPLSKGGADAEWNLVPACAACNLPKGAKTLAEWAVTFNV